MKKLSIITALVLSGFALSAQNKPVSKSAVKTGTVKVKSNTICKTGKSCCKNEKALSALRRPTAKPLAMAKKS